MYTVEEVTTIAEAIANDGGLRDSHGGNTSERNASLLLGGAAINLARIADAVQKLMKDNPDPTAPTSLRSLTAEERAVIEALRAGDMELVTFHTDGKANPGYIVNGVIEPSD